uniref:Uncharacterized protein n=1 Tax=Odontella aurita TaxID=265563 RepID=A0A7S4NG17_9STRA|mmetsp:Transcript_61875/g.182740  ORF Transcript_61875/g.182740 Transcript_61875/m.182740 type:complete len:442 (+) Transcript_61875:243-1568(+)|eukprot:CAMPEP_0113574104 /NCGR_PEP_ID=MMETSP0015_2-20120614/26969_1 /TAXON_ID=2838 /ORGANISM="Odontella" /LENGTH=441 /DNA_ID=CAMNT_0000477219 /DNA_START=142 /DNA_END=1467 /DNA_ORIENTATION=- /assembly_acc=CAM_ASM_000160
MAQPQRPTQSRRRRGLACASALIAGTSLLVLSKSDDVVPSSYRGLVKESGGPSASGSDDGDRRRGVIFYNVYIPPESAAASPEEALNVVREQMSQLDASGRARTLPVRFGLIGDESKSDDVERICRGADGARDCSRVAYEEKGNEWVTLQPLYDHCRENPSEWVTYMHNKGSFHPSPENDRMRRMITKAALSDECQTASADVCNVCSNRFTPLPFLHTSGNHWTASCEYVRLLIPPLYFYPAMDEVMLEDEVEHVLSWVNEGKGWKHGLYETPVAAAAAEEEDKNAEVNKKKKARAMTVEEKNRIRQLAKMSIPETYRRAVTFMGRGRFALEHWILSHPRQRPCDVYPGEYAWGHTDLPPPPGDDWTPDLRRAPRFDTIEQFVIPPFEEAIGEPWYCGMESRLFEFDKLYEEVPFLDSWVWDFYERSKEYCQRKQQQQGAS